MDNYNYPLGADTSDAPWNQEDLQEREIEVTVSVTISSTVKVKVSDYEVIDSGKDEDGHYYEHIDYSNCDLKKAVEEQIILPLEAYDILRAAGNESCPNWIEDDLEVILE